MLHGGCCNSPTSSLGVLLKKNIYLCLSCSLWDLVPSPGIEPKLPALGARSLSYWTTREVPPSTSLSACPPAVLDEPIPALDPQLRQPCRPAVPCTTVLIQSNNSEEQTAPLRCRTSCLLLSSSPAIHTMRQIKRNANSRPIPNCLAPSRLESWETYVPLCNTGLLPWNRLSDISLSKQIYLGSTKNCHSGFATKFILFLVEIHCPSTMLIMLLWYHGRCQRPEGYNFTNDLNVRLFVTPLTVAHQAPLSMGFSRQEYRSGLPFPLQGIFLTEGWNPGLLHCRQIKQRYSYWSIVALQCCVSFCRPAKWISHVYTYIPSLMSLSSPFASPSQPSRSSLGLQPGQAMCQFRLDRGKGNCETLVNKESMAFIGWAFARKEVFFLLVGSVIISGHESSPFWRPNCV